MDPTAEDGGGDGDGDGSDKKGKLRTAKHEEAVREDLLEELEVNVQDLDMDPYSLLCKCWGNWKVMSCGERMATIKTVCNQQLLRPLLPVCAHCAICVHCAILS